MSTIKTKDGTEIFFKDWGKGQPLVFSHGWPLSADDWDTQMLFFLSHGYRVIAHDRRGHGRSSQTSDGHDGPGRGVRCALAFGTASKEIGLPLRAGLHTGEIEIRGRHIGGIAVHAAARVMANSQSSEVLVSRVVTDLVAGTGLKFSERGSHDLKGLPGRWDLMEIGMAQR